MTDKKLTAFEASLARRAFGAQCSDKSTAFRVWAPTAERVVLRLYENGALLECMEMRGENGVFECRARGDFDGFEYAFELTRGGKTALCADIYAKAVSADGRRSVLVNMKRHAPEGWENDAPIPFPERERAVICELSVRDFSMDSRAGFKNRGKFAALCETNIRNSHGDIAGLPYIKASGATHIQLMPVFDFDFDGGEYNWGYNPRFHNAPSGYYAQSDGVKELRALVAAAHKEGLGVVFDVVYNHVYDVKASAYEKLFPDYYFRKDPQTRGLSNGSGCGNEFASERAAARKFIADSLAFLAREYHADGFRFDLMGLLDIKTLRLAEKKLRVINPDILLYGEGWTGGVSPLPERERAVLSNAGRLTGFAFFNDVIRDALKGSVFSAPDCGFVNGAADDAHYERIRAALAGELPASLRAKTHGQSINYAECHDNLTLFDKLSATLNGDLARIKQAEKMTAALLLLSPGMTFLQLGQAFMRSKNGADNSYNLPDEVNAVKWDGITEYRDIADYYAGMAAFRKKHLNDFGTRAFEKRGSGFVMTAGAFILLVSPAADKIGADIAGTFEIFADENRASDAALYKTDRLVCAGYSILLARKIK